jgi:LPS O-antigen subunit length determinant protein (WzzB/FepE family)
MYLVVLQAEAEVAIAQRDVQIERLRQAVTNVIETDGLS